MTVEADYNIQTYEGNGETKVFTIPFKFFNNEVAVYKNRTYETYTKDVDYTVKQNGTGGEIVFGKAPLSGESITIVRSVPLNQLVTFIEGEAFPARDYEYSLDRIMMALQEMWADLQKVVIPPAEVSLKDFIGNYYNKLDVNKKLEDYYTKEDVDDKVVSSMATTYLFQPSSWGERVNYEGEYKYQAVGGVRNTKNQKFVSAFLTFEESDAESGKFSPVFNWTQQINDLAQLSWIIYAKEIPTDDVVVTLTFIA